MGQHKVGDCCEDFGFQRQILIAENICPHTIGRMVFHRGQQPCCAIRSKFHVIVQQQDTVAVDFIVRQSPLRDHSLRHPYILFPADLKRRTGISFGDIDEDAVWLQGLGLERLKFLPELVAGGAEGTDGYGIGQHPLDNLAIQSWLLENV